MRLHIDWQQCDAHGSCLELLPEILETDDWGYPRGVGGSDVGVPDDLVPAAREAVRLCPKLALALRES